MHICCSNCAVLPLQHYLLKGADITGLWFNPNIHPYTEYAARLGSLKKLSGLWDLDVEYIDDYALDDFLKHTVGKGPDRCGACYTFRLDKAAATAKKMDMDGFTTSLLASPYQKFDMIIRLGTEAGRKHGIAFHAEDLRRGWRMSRGLSAELGLYRQKYCGCIYSEMERYAPKDK